MTSFSVSLLFGIIWRILRCKCCPSTTYVRCAGSGAICTIHSSVKEGYLAYGIEGRWSLTPFTNSGVSDLSIECAYYLGDPYVWKTKECCYIEVYTGFTEADFNKWTIAEGPAWVHSTLVTQNYGAQNKYIYRVFENSYGYCDYRFFGDPVPGVGKLCSYKKAPVSFPNEDDWTLCAVDGNLCGELSKSAAHWIRYGTDGHYYFRLVLSTDGEIGCTYNLFNDPVWGKTKSCWRSPPLYTFAISGNWESVPLCQGCVSNSWESKKGVTDLSSSEITDSWSMSLTESAKESTIFEGVEMSATVSSSIASTELSSQTLTKEASYTFECDKPYLYQWVTGATQNNGVESKTFSVYGIASVCSWSYEPPKCPAGYCLYDATHTACQVCTPQYQEHLALVEDEWDWNVTSIAVNFTYNDPHSEDSVLPFLPNLWISVVMCVSSLYNVYMI